MRWLALALVAVTALAAPSASSAPERDARIRVGIGIGKVEIGMTLAQARRALGRPKHVLETESLGFGRRYMVLVWGQSEDLSAAFLGRRGQERAVWVRTYSPSERTPQGAGVGMLMTTARSRLRSLRPRCERRLLWDYAKAEEAGKPEDQQTGPRRLFQCVVTGDRTRTIFHGLVRCKIPIGHPQVCDLPNVRILVGQVVIERLGLSDDQRPSFPPADAAGLDPG